MSYQQGWLNWAFVQLLLLRGGLSNSIRLLHFKQQSQLSYGIKAYSQPLHEKLLIFASLLSPSNSRTIVSSQYLVNTATFAKNTPLRIVFCSSLNVWYSVKHSVSCLIYHLPLSGYHIKHSFLCFESSKNILLLTFPKGLFTWREDDPRRRNNFSLSLCADIFVRVVAK